MAFGAPVNVAAERLAYRRLRRAPKLAPLITAVGLSFVFQWHRPSGYERLGAEAAGRQHPGRPGLHDRSVIDRLDH